jgi:hypothetical protein
MCEIKHQALFASRKNNLRAAIHHGLQVANMGSFGLSNMGSLGLSKQARGHCTRINAELKLY